jgi:hypothetical protein
MNSLEEDTVLDFLESIPIVTTTDRLRVCSNGQLGLDIMHDYTGSFGRCVLNTVIGGYNRRDIMSTLSCVMRQMTRLATRCVVNLDSPYIRGNMKAFKIRTLGTAYYEKCLTRLVHGTNKLQELLSSLLLVYGLDVETCILLQDLVEASQKVQSLLRPITVFTV